MKKNIMAILGKLLGLNQFSQLIYRFGIDIIGLILTISNC